MPDRLEIASRLLVRSILGVCAVWLSIVVHALLGERLVPDNRPALARVLEVSGTAAVPLGLPARAPEAFPAGYDVSFTPGLPGTGVEAVPVDPPR